MLRFRGLSHSNQRIFMKNFRIFCTLLFCTFAQSQQLDESYLDSLPEDIREDLIEKSEKQTENAKENYRASIYSSRMGEDESLINLKARLEADLEELERRLKTDDEITANKCINDEIN